MRSAGSAAASLLAALALFAGCGAPAEPTDYGTYDPATPTPEPTPTATRTPLPTLPPTPVPTPVPWTDYQVNKATLSGDAIDLWVSLEDEANTLTESTLDALVEAGQITPLQAAGYQQAAAATFNEIFTTAWANTTLSEALANQTAYCTQRVIPTSATAFTLEYYIWNLGVSADDARIATLPGSNGAATGQVSIPLEIQTLSSPISLVIHVEQASVGVAPLSGNTLTGLLPWEDVEALLTALALSTMATFELPPEDQAAYLARLDALLSELERDYANQTLSGGGPALGLNVRYDAVELPNASLPW